MWSSAPWVCVLSFLSLPGPAEGFTALPTPGRSWPRGSSRVSPYGSSRVSTHGSKVSQEAGSDTWKSIYDQSRAQGAEVAADLASELDFLTTLCVGGSTPPGKDDQCELFWDETEATARDGTVQTAVDKSVGGMDAADFQAIGVAVRESLANLDAVCTEHPDDPRCVLLDLDDQGPDHTVTLE